MRKKTRMIKRAVSLFLIIFMCINSFAAVISDNDGSAFITKGEFDSIKNDFQTQINDYNTSIDNKIDGAIAQYLAGVQIGKNSTKNILIGNGYKTVGYYDDKTNMQYVNGAVGLAFSAYGVSHTGPNGTSKTSGSVKSTSVTVVTVSRPAVAGAECCVTYDSSKPIHYIWNGYYGNVLWNVSTNARFSNALQGSYWSSVINYELKGPIFDNLLFGFDKDLTKIKGTKIKGTVIIIAI